MDGVGIVQADEALPLPELAGLSTAVLGDILDQLGYCHQFLPPEIRPLRPETKLVGRAMPVVIEDVSGRQEKPFGLLTEALDNLQPGNVFLAQTGSALCAAWGEILTATAKTRGAVGAVVDGYHRDTPQVLDQRWPVFSRGPYAQDAAVRSAVVGFGVPVVIGDVRASPGDLVVGDVDGVLIVPQAAEWQTIELAREKRRAEGIVRKAIEGGMSSTDAFQTYGVL